MKTIIFDIDGTLADLNGREQFLHNGKKDWESFNANMDKDLPNTPIVELYRTLYNSKQYELILISGRQEHFRQVTQTWLTRHQIPFDTLLMRADTDSRHDCEVKQDILKSLQAQGKEILLSVDDRQSVVDMWRANGITCLQCTKGDY